MSFPSGVTDGYIHRTPNGTVYEFDINSLKWTIRTFAVNEGSSFPGTPRDGDFFWDTPSEALYRYEDDATAWIQVG